jgi:3-phosphoshikimate 1-carboxyvinyltransferase
MEITVPSLGSGALQGDYLFLEILEKMGANVTRRLDGTTVKGPEHLHGLEVSMRHISDTVMTLAALAPLCSGPVVIRDIGNIRLKETDRLQALVTELTRLGQKVEHGQDWIAIHPRPVTPCVVECYRDHRMAMAFAILGLCVPGVVISDPACVAKTYPGFWDDLSKLITTQGISAPW